MSELDLRRKNWVVPFLRVVAGHFDDGAARSRLAGYSDSSAVHYEAWLSEALRSRGLLSGAPIDVWPRADAALRGAADWWFVNTLTHQVEMLAELRILHGLAIDGVGDQIQVLMVLAASCGLYLAAEQLYELSLDDWGPVGDPRRVRLAKAMGPAVRSLGDGLKGGGLHPSDQPLLGLPFHHVLVYSATCQVAALGHEQFGHGGRIDEPRLRRMQADAHMQRLHLIEAIIALANADGTITRVERRLIDDVITLARLSPAEVRMVLGELRQPLTPERLGELIGDPRTRRFLFEQLVLHGHLDGELLPQEQAFIDALAEAFDLDRDACLACEAEALAYLDAHPGLVEAFSLGGAVRRFRKHLLQQVESVVRVNLGRLVTEIRETRELAQLLVKRAQGPLSDGDEAKMRAQLIDICKTVPALAVFAAPGGTVLLPILMRLLPFDLMPSAFTEGDEGL